jgi:hypothetical protein
MSWTVYSLIPQPESRQGPKGNYKYEAMIEEGSQALLYFGLKAFLLEKYPGMIFYLGRSAYGESSPFLLE